MQALEIRKMDERIRKMRTLAEELRQMGNGIQAVERNVERILASICVLELNISDAEPHL